MDIPENILKDIIRHTNVVYKGFEKPTTKVRDNARLLKKDIDKLKNMMNNDCKRSNNST